MGLKEDLDKIRKDGEKAFKDKDVKGAAAHIHDDIIVLRPGKEVIKGKAAAQQELQQFMHAKKPLNMEKTVDVATAMGSDWAMERGHWKKEKMSGHFLTVWKKEGGTWKAFHDCSNVLKTE